MERDAHRITLKIEPTLYDRMLLAKIYTGETLQVIMHRSIRRELYKIESTHSDKAHSVLTTIKKIMKNIEPGKNASVSKSAFVAEIKNDIKDKLIDIE